MKVCFTRKFYCAVVVVFVSVSNVSAKISYQDTTTLIASVPKNSILQLAGSLNPSRIKRDLTLNVSNVVYPLILENHRQQSLKYVETFSNKKRDYVIHTYQRGRKYFPKVTAVFKHYQLPQELKVLMALESGFIPNSISKAGAVGYWQILDNVAKEYGLKIANPGSVTSPNVLTKDERNNFSKSTIAAARYLRDRGSDLNNNLLLMVAAYNCGVGKVKNAIRKSGKANADFWDVKRLLPAETRNYVMNFIALNVIFENYEKFTKKQLVFFPEQNDSIPAVTAVYEKASLNESVSVD